MNAGRLVFIALAPVVHQRLPAGFGAAMFLAWSIRALLLGSLVLFAWLRPASHVLSGLAHVPLAAVDLPAGASSASAECGVVALAEILRRAFLVPLLVALRRSRLLAASVTAGLLTARRLVWRPAFALLRLAGPALRVLSLPFLPAWLLPVFALLVGPHGCVCATGFLPPVIPPSFLRRILLRLTALVMAPFLLLISHVALFLFLCGFTWHLVLSFHYLPHAAPKMPARLSAEKGNPSREVGRLMLPSRGFSLSKREGFRDAVTNRYITSFAFADFVRAPSEPPSKPRSIITSVDLISAATVCPFCSRISRTASAVIIEVMCWPPIDSVICAIKPMVLISVTRPMS